MTDTDDMSSPSVGYLVWQLATRWQLELDRALAPLRLTAAQYAVLASLHAQSGHAPRQRELAEFTGLDRIHVSKLVRALEEAGMLTRTRHPADSRALAVRITDTGRRAVVAARREVLALEEQRLLALGGRHGRRADQLVASLHALLRHTTDPPPGTEEGTTESR